MYACICMLYVYVCVYVYMYVYMYACMYVCMYVCLYECVCMYVSLYVCIYVCIYMMISISTIYLSIYLSKLPKHRFDGSMYRFITEDDASAQIEATHAKGSGFRVSGLHIRYTYTEHDEEEADLGKLDLCVYV